MIAVRPDGSVPTLSEGAVQASSTDDSDECCTCDSGPCSCPKNSPWTAGLGATAAIRLGTQGIQVSGSGPKVSHVPVSGVAGSAWGNWWPKKIDGTDTPPPSPWTNYGDYQSDFDTVEQAQGAWCAWASQVDGHAQGRWTVSGSFSFEGRESRAHFRNDGVHDQIVCVPTNEAKCGVGALFSAQSDGTLTCCGITAKLEVEGWDFQPVGSSVDLGVSIYLSAADDGVTTIYRYGAGGTYTARMYAKPSASDFYNQQNYVEVIATFFSAVGTMPATALCAGSVLTISNQAQGQTVLKVPSHPTTSVRLKDGTFHENAVVCTDISYGFSQDEIDEGTGATHASWVIGGGGSITVTLEDCPADPTVNDPSSSSGGDSSSSSSASSSSSSSSSDSSSSGGSSSSGSSSADSSSSSSSTGSSSSGGSSSSSSNPSSSSSSSGGSGSSGGGGGSSSTGSSSSSTSSSSASSSSASSSSSAGSSSASSGGTGGSSSSTGGGPSSTGCTLTGTCAHGRFFPNQDMAVNDTVITTRVVIYNDTCVDVGNDSPSGSFTDGIGRQYLYTRAVAGSDVPASVDNTAGGCPQDTSYYIYVTRTA